MNYSKMFAFLLVVSVASLLSGCVNVRTPVLARSLDLPKCNCNTPDYFVGVMCEKNPQCSTLQATRATGIPLTSGSTALFANSPSNSLPYCNCSTPPHVVGVMCKKNPRCSTLRTVRITNIENNIVTFSDSQGYLRSLPVKDKQMLTGVNPGQCQIETQEDSEIGLRIATIKQENN